MFKRFGHSNMESNQWCQHLDIAVYNWEASNKLGVWAFSSANLIVVYLSPLFTYSAYHPVTAFLTDNNDQDNLIELISKFSAISGAKFNLAKTYHLSFHPYENEPILILKYFGFNMNNFGWDLDTLESTLLEKLTTLFDSWKNSYTS